MAGFAVGGFHQERPGVFLAIHGGLGSIHQGFGLGFPACLLAFRGFIGGQGIEHLQEFGLILIAVFTDADLLA
jgi:hypothetical protein